MFTFLFALGALILAIIAMVTVDSLKTKIQALEDHVRRLSGQGGSKSREDKLPPLQQAKPPATAGRSAGKRLPPPLPKSATRKPGGASEGMAATPSVGDVLGIVAALCLIIAASFLVKLAIESGWLTPIRQWAAAGLLGLTMIGAGLAFRKRDEIYFSLLPGAGVVVLYLTVYGGHLILGLYGLPQTLILLSAVGAVSIALFMTFRQDFFLVLATVGSYLIPVLAPTLRHSLGLSMPYYLVWDLAFAGMAVALQRRRLLQIAAYLSLVTFATSHPAFVSGGVNPDLMDIALFQAVQFLIFAAALVVYTVYHGQAMSLLEAVSLVPLLLFFYGLEYSYADRLFKGDTAAWIGAAYGVLIMLLYRLARWARQTGPLESGTIISGYVALIWFHTFYLELVPERWSPWFGLGVLAFLAATQGWMRYTSRHGIAGAVALAAPVLEYGKLLFGRTHLDGGEALLLNGLYMLAAYGAWAAADNIKEKESRKAASWVTLTLAHLQAIVLLYRLTDVANWGYQSRVVVSVMWACYALAVLGLAWGLKKRLVAYSALIVFFVAIGKAMLFDLAASSTGTRILSFLGLGIVLFISGWIFKKIQVWIPED